MTAFQGDHEDLQNTIIAFVQHASFVMYWLNDYLVWLGQVVDAHAHTITHVHMHTYEELFVSLSPRSKFMVRTGKGG